jgi:hypothetical protein
VFAWIWPLLLWSQLGSREQRYFTESLIFCSPHILTRQLPAIWSAGVLLALATGSGMGLRLLIVHDWHTLVGWLGGALFIPSLALALGIWSGGSKAFEAIYTVWWYIGPLHHTPGLDFMATTPQSTEAAFYLGLSIVLLIAAYAGRRRRLAYA